MPCGLLVEPRSEMDVTAYPVLVVAWESFSQTAKLRGCLTFLRQTWQALSLISGSIGEWAGSFLSIWIGLPKHRSTYISVLRALSSFVELMSPNIPFLALHSSRSLSFTGITHVCPFPHRELPLMYGSQSCPSPSTASHGIPGIGQ